MTGKKKRMSMLDTLAAAGAPAPPAPMMTSNRALRSARDAVDAHNVWELDPALIEDDRLADRLDRKDVADLRDSIEQTGQAVPILVRRNPADPDRYLLVYGRRRLEAIRWSDKVKTVRALVATLDERAAVETQIAENMARRDLTFIEKALFAKELVESGFGNQSEVAEVLTVTKSSVSMAMSIAEAVGPDLARAIGPAPGIGRPRWEALAAAIEATGARSGKLIGIAEEAHHQAAMTGVLEGGSGAGPDASVLAFEAVAKAVGKPPAPPAPKTAPARRPAAWTLAVDGRPAGTLRRTAKGLQITLDDPAFADWIETEAQTLIEDLHERWRKHSED